ncbi:hypothetical protein CS8_034980 [Cupriavidus sp. 8B]
MDMPAGTGFGGAIGTYQMGNDLAAGCLCNAKVAVDKEVTQATAGEVGVAWFDVRELVFLADHDLQYSKVLVYKMR